METGCAQNDTVGIFRENSAVTSCTVRINAWAGYIIIRVPRHIIPILVCTGLRLANAAYPALQTALDLLGRKDIYVGTVEGFPASSGARSGSPASSAWHSLRQSSGVASSGAPIENRANFSR